MPKVPNQNLINPIPVPHKNDRVLKIFIFLIIVTLLVGAVVVLKRNVEERKRQRIINELRESSMRAALPEEEHDELVSQMNAETGKKEPVSGQERQSLIDSLSTSSN